MQPEESITEWIARLRAGDPAAAQPLWERYCFQLASLARTRLQGLRSGMADEEDVVLSAFQSFCAALQGGRFPQLSDRDGLWRLLVVLTERKAISLRRAETSAKRGGSARTPTALAPPLETVIDSTPTPAFAALVAEECVRRLEQLPDDTFRSLALLKLEGYNNEEIAARLGCALRTVERKLQLIRTRWEQEENP